MYLEDMQMQCAEKGHAMVIQPTAQNCVSDAQDMIMDK